MVVGSQAGIKILQPKIWSSLCTIPGMKGRECRDKVWNKKGKLPGTRFTLLASWFLHLMIFFWSLYLFYLFMRRERDWRWWTPGLEGCSHWRCINPREEAFLSSSAFPEQKKDKFSTLALLHFIHMKNEDCNINFSAVYEALCQIGKKTIIE